MIFICFIGKEHLILYFAYVDKDIIPMVKCVSCIFAVIPVARLDTVKLLYSPMDTRQMACDIDQNLIF